MIKVLDVQRLNVQTHENQRQDHLRALANSLYKIRRTITLEEGGFIYKVDAYIPKARIRYVCYRIGHIDRDCKSIKSRCLFYELTREEDYSWSTDQAHAKCINCEGDHLVTLAHMPCHY